MYTGTQGTGLLIKSESGTAQMNVSPYSKGELSAARHTCDLPSNSGGNVYLHMDHKHMVRNDRSSTR